MKKKLVQAIMLLLKGKHRPDSVRQPRTLETENAPVRSYYIDSNSVFFGLVSKPQFLEASVFALI
jgi:hypothetical protein